MDLDGFQSLTPDFFGGLVLFLQDACLRRLLEGLLIYSVLLKRVEEEFPSSSILSEVRFYSNILIKELENKVGLRKKDHYF